MAIFNSYVKLPEGNYIYNMIRSLMTGTPNRSINAFFFGGVSAAVRLTLEAMQEQDHRDAVENSEVL